MQEIRQTGSYQQQDALAHFADLPQSHRSASSQHMNSSRMATALGNMEAPTVTTHDGAVLAYKIHGVAGGGTPVMVIPGLYQVKEDLEELGVGIARNRQVCISDPRGMGQSIQTKPFPPSTTPPEITLVQLATDVFDIILSLGWKRIILAGVGYGGTIAQHLALLLRGRDDIHLEGLVLVASAPLTPSRGSLSRETLKMLQGASNGQSVSMDKAREWITTNLSTVYCSTESQKVDRLVEEFIGRRRDARIGEEQVFSLDGINLTDQLGLLCIPTLIVHGKNDAMIDCWYATVLADLIARSSLVLLPGVGHWVHVMALSRLTEETLQFIDGVSSQFSHSD
ncbi:hypothetical protein BASA61_006166 [Batrachochytrium salamandrivorans]|nr:hypothetical protein BASA62_005505 [Batrachochytrium salamandrivorans]KAH6587903.1 hypothetical protein BASA61_006166 [Batrachochytrium salamandrivorans]KAH9247286.1 hypothetical protein BASA81_015128 [Batrachochytrium salamandrivorans]